MQTRPLIAISPNHFPAEDRPLYKDKPLEYGEGAMARALREVGALPIMPYRAGLEPGGDLAALAEAVMQRCDGLLLSGGADVDPASYGQPLRDPRWAGDPSRDAYELALYAAAVALDKPVLGVCRGAQLINVAEGGTLWQDLPSERPGDIVHRDQVRYDTNAHGLEVAPGGLVAALFEGEGAPRVNSVHHQGVLDLAPSATAEAWAPDGLVEAFRVHTRRWSVAVQWHPEWLGGPSSHRLFSTFVAEATR
ncbi:MAG: gamma-glutamyl-gamma-aminobutyrate hydrolase family protein [Deltaproteobacteria bacterium]|nr:MAG: gamma-glutamyl-gamma-aminobutyrate hydrolase family protein [Deltaproteobacteria bacterium]